MTQVALARDMGISDKAVSAWERDETVPELSRLVALRRLLHVTFIWLLDGSGEPPRPDDPAVLFEDAMAQHYREKEVLSKQYLRRHL